MTYFRLKYSTQHKSTTRLSLMCFILIIFWTSGYAFSADTSNQRTFLWKVQGPSAGVFLLGSMHFANKNLYPLDPRIENAFKQSSVLVVEVNIDNVDPMQIQQMMFSKGMYTDERSIESEMAPDIVEMLSNYCIKNNIPMAALSKMKPGLLVITLSAEYLVRQGFLPEYGIDMHFLQKAKDSKPIMELETFQEQVDLLMDTKHGSLFLKQTLLSFEKMEIQLKEIVSAWATGDSQTMNQLMIIDPLNQSPELKPIYKKLFFDRNINMARKIEGYLNSSGIYFVVVGAGHLVGKKGIVQLLKNKNYEVTQM